MIIVVATQSPMQPPETHCHPSSLYNEKRVIKFGILRFCKRKGILQESNPPLPPAGEPPPATTDLVLMQHVMVTCCQATSHEFAAYYAGPSFGLPA
ncbi:hypothetical protein ACJIZ3_014175 [Penstemon smallii]|uniref:Uncharacterized protein n=1 Tax=Penstemon smallii TaxID=265156 RepID=A0ABD3RIR6_9LAMI